MTSSFQPWVEGHTISQTLDRAAEQFGDRQALVFPQLGRRWTYAGLRREVRTVARALLAVGVQKGEHVGIWATNCPEWFMIQHAAAHVGAVLVNINPAYRGHELEYVLNQADITTLLLTDRFKASSFFDLVDTICPELASSTPGQLRSKACPRLRWVISTKQERRPGMLNWPEFLNRAEAVGEAALADRELSLDSHEVVNIQYTSGTTGFPKGAMLTHRNLLYNAFCVGQRLHFTEQDRLCLPVPFYHCFGCVMGNLMVPLFGAALVVPAESFDAEATLQAIHGERCTALYGVPTMFIAELNHPRFAEFDLGSLRTGIMAGSPCPIEVMREVVNRMGAREITIGYGLTEASPIITQTEATDSLEHRVSTVGTAVPGLDVRIVAPGSLDPVPDGQPGELIVRGHGVMKGYYNKPNETAAAVTADGWLRSGDLALRTPDGYYRITGRIKDMIIRGGENIYPREIEEFLYQHPAIADVQVVGLPDERYGEEICAWIRPREGVAIDEEEIKGFCRDRIARFKVPRYIVVVNEFPTTVTGKIQKFRLRELGVERFGLQRAAGIQTA